MPDTVTIEVTGLKTIQAALKELPRAMRETILRAAIVESGEILKEATAQNIHSRTGRTVKALRVDVQLDGDAIAGAALIGGSKEKGARGFVLNILEHGAKAHPEPKARKGETIRVTLGTRTITHRAAAPKRRFIAFGSKVYSKIQHPPLSAQAPLRIALGQVGEQSVTAFGRRAWEGIVQALERGKGLG
jgi:hypothetical protein